MTAAVRWEATTIRASAGRSAAGVEYAFTDNLVGRAEYRYTDFGDFDFAISNFTATSDLTTNDVRLGIAYKF